MVALWACMGVLYWELTAGKTNLFQMLLAFFHCNNKNHGKEALYYQVLDEYQDLHER